MRVKEKLEGTKKILNEIFKRNAESPIIVEGKKDVKALRKLGAEGDIIKIKRNDTVFHIIENLRGKYEGVIILTDWDRSGSRLYSRIKKACKANGIKYREDLRTELIKYVKTEIKDIESIPKFIKRLEIIVSDPYNARN